MYLGALGLSTSNLEVKPIILPCASAKGIIIRPRNISLKPEYLLLTKPAAFNSFSLKPLDFMKVNKALPPSGA